MSSGENDAVAPNAKRLLWAGFMAILAAGVGYAVRGGILTQWANEFGFTMTELGAITGGGLTGFGVVIILSSLIADKIGYGRLLIMAFILHLVSAGLTLAGLMTLPCRAVRFDPCSTIPTFPPVSVP